MTKFTLGLILLILLFIGIYALGIYLFGWSMPTLVYLGMISVLVGAWLLAPN